MQLSIVMPAYNEAAQIEPCVSEWYESVISKIPDSELIVVNDCSTDMTARCLDALESRFPLLRVFHTPVNGGHGRAVRLGLDKSVGEFVFQTDSDRQHSPAEFWTLWAHRDTADFVFGVRASRADGLLRLAISQTLRLANFCMWGHWIADANCPFKLMRRGPLLRVLEQVPPNAFVPMVMVSILARRYGFRVQDVRVQHFPRTAGEPSLAGVVKWASVGTRCLRELLALRTARQQVGARGARLAARAKVE